MNLQLEVDGFRQAKEADTGWAEAAEARLNERDAEAGADEREHDGRIGGLLPPYDFQAAFRRQPTGGTG